MAKLNKRGENPAKGYLSRYIGELPFSRFTNEHGEVFDIHSNGVTAFMSGSEVDSMVDDNKRFEGYIPLFNPNFNMFSNEELFKIGNALQDVAIQNGYRMETEDETFEYRGYFIYARASQEGSDLYTVNEQGKPITAQSLGYLNETVIWYEIYDEANNLVEEGEELNSIEKAKSLIDKIEG